MLSTAQLDARRYFSQKHSMLILSRSYLKVCNCLICVSLPTVLCQTIGTSFCIQSYGDCPHILMSLIIIFIPFYILMYRGFLKRERQIQLATGKSFLVWFILSINAATIVYSGIGNIRVLVYLLNLIMAYSIIWKFKLPMSYIFISVIIPWLSIFYLLVIGQLRNTDKSPILV